MCGGPTASTSHGISPDRQSLDDKAYGAAMFALSRRSTSGDTFAHSATAIGAAGALSVGLDWRTAH